VLILVRNQRRARGSMSSTSTRSQSRSRSRTHSRSQPPPLFLTRETEDSNYPITRPPPLRIYTGHPGTVGSSNMTPATIGHHGAMHQFPVSSGQGSASSRTTSYGHHSGVTSHSTPRRPPQIPSLGLSQARPFLRSVASAFSYHASAGHAAAQEREAQEQEAQEQEAQERDAQEQDAHERDASATNVGGTASISGSRTLATTEESGMTVPIEDPSEHSAKSSQ
jgi:hypothetical protein